ncbi:MAG: hypothetical protein A2748_03685 [Candidatus Wildermuthbacteria bacterium RIFCSPHIGHO2_01_FULL_45_20]|uniref:LamG-like jellyroll fold domain-containing protein n=1 Tax=Candidatus Wildermuthbacteria bacterium RIFCSPHIGHO2_02_FULL_45_25 TaxID=1802450 RepID=A0A1G2R5A3_9BACT|nr:MAG: hypothetical protein A2748_03685 [Candidatus Wildermuthbacteria bacterium RIFCSPHIGHO2_01_FULL_45_20]OHA67738.1 MAG: hypothetical protein A3C04_00425 [Candidatus Wildermuthbacteria bacterium RIFCSPHIGHO2_02_FULL_45_25]
MRKGFTLIELLVVIAIIGLLASIVTVSLSSSQDRAKQAKIESFASQVHHALAADAVGIWDFDDAAAGTANDTSGLKNNGVLTGHSPTAAADRNGQAGKAYSFNGTSQYISLPSTDIIGTRTTFTITAWINLDDVAGSSIYGEFGSVAGHTRNYLAIVGGNLSFDQYTPTLGPNEGNTVLQTGKWYYVAYVQNGSTWTTYINEVLDKTGISAETYGGDPPDKAIIGARAYNAQPGGLYRYFDGSIDGVRIYNRALSSAQIQQLHAEGLSDHQLATP